MPTTQQLRRCTAIVGVTALIVLVAACSSSGDESAPTTAPDTSDTSTDATAVSPTGPAAPETPAGGFPVRTRSVILTDTERPTPDVEGTGVPASDERTLITTFTYPDDPGPFPLIAFAHGHNGHPRKFTELLETWAAAGFVVVAPAFPLSNDEVPGVATVFDLPSQAGDLSFAISSALRMSGEPDSFLQGRVNPEAIGVGGLSLGGATTYMAAFDECCRDARVDAVIVMDGFHPDLSGMDLTGSLPLLIFHADDDPVLPYSGAAEVFAAASPPKYLVTIHETVHAQPYEDDADPADQMVLDTTTAFWRLYLARDADAATDLSSSARVDGLTEVVEQPG